SLVRFLRQGSPDHRLVRRGQRFQVRNTRDMLQHELSGGGAVVRKVSREQLLKRDRQVVLVGESADYALEGLRSSVERGHTAGNLREHAFQIFDQAEIPNLDMVVKQEEILRLDVEVL